MNELKIHIPRYEEPINFPAFDANIPSYVRYDRRLSSDAKILYAEIRALTSAYGFCWAKNTYLAALYGVSEKTISRWIKQLEDAGHIVVTKERDDTDGKLYRIIRLKFPNLEQDPSPGYQLPEEDDLEEVEDDFEEADDEFEEELDEYEEEKPRKQRNYKASKKVDKVVPKKRTKLSKKNGQNCPTGKNKYNYYNIKFNKIIDSAKKVKPNFKNFSQRDYDFAALEYAMLNRT